MSDELKHQPARATDFLTNFHDGEEVYIYAMEPDEKSGLRPRKALGRDNTRKCIDKMQNCNVYFLPACIKTALRSRRAFKPKKDDIAGSRWLWVDIDPTPDRPLDRIIEDVKRFAETQELHPSLIVKSGGGLQCFWQLTEEIGPDSIESKNRWLVEQLDADSSFDCCRMMRVPYTVNYPNAKKRKQGRAPILSSVHFADWTMVYMPDEFGDIGEAPDAVYTAGWEPDFEFATASAEDIIAKLPAAVAPFAMQSAGDDGDRSKHVMCFCVRALKHLEPEQVMGLLINPNMPVSEHVLEKHNGRSIEEYAARQVARAIEFRNSHTAPNGQVADASMFRAITGETETDARNLLYGRWDDAAAEYLTGGDVAFFHGAWYQYDDAHNVYLQMSKNDFDSSVFQWLNANRDRFYTFVKDRKTGTITAVPKTVEANIGHSAEMGKALWSSSHSWRPSCVNIERGEPEITNGVAPRDLMVLQNGVLNLKTRELHTARPSFFATTCIQAKYEPDAAKPSQWLKFLDDVFQGAKDSRDTLQEFMGYLLTTDTSYQKMLIMVSPPRGGKGTITRMIQSFLNEKNYISPTVQQLTSDFGKAGLIDASAVFLSDLRQSKNDRNIEFLELLLRIIGEDEITVSRKYMEDVTVRTPARIMITSNMFPRLPDVSGALMARMLFIRTYASFVGKEDPNLLVKLEREKTGILNWCLEGLFRLRERGAFTAGAAIASELRAIKLKTSPVKLFAEERMIPLYGQSDCTLMAAYEMFHEWIREELYSYHGDLRQFGEDLRTSGIYELDIIKINGEYHIVNAAFTL